MVIDMLNVLIAETNENVNMVKGKTIVLNVTVLLFVCTTGLDIVVFNAMFVNTRR